MVIAGALVLQISAILIRSGPWAWPFTNYPMYASAHYENERVKALYFVYATFEDGNEKLIEYEDIGTTRPFHRVWAETLINYPEDEFTLGAERPAIEHTGSALRKKLKEIVSRKAIAANYRHSFLKIAQSNLGKRIVHLRVEDYPAIITRDGWVQADESVVVKELKVRHTD